VHDLEASARDTLQRFNAPPDNRPLSEIWRALRTRRKLGWWDRVLAFVWYPRLRNLGPYQHDDDPREETPFEGIFGVLSARWWMRCLRAALYTALMWLFLINVLVPVFGGPRFDPARGQLAHWLFDRTTVVDGVLTLFLTFLVVDALCYSRAFIKRLTRISTGWSSFTVAQYRLRYHLRNSDDLADWIDLRFVAERTRSVTQLVYLPFIALAVLLFSRSPLLDNFPMPLALVLAQATILSAIIGAVLAYRSTAEHARQVACRHVANRIIAAKGRGDSTTADQLNQLLTNIQELRDGAFAPWSSQPIVRAVLLPLVTYGGTLLLHIYALPGT
jgi:hypothetical protein